MLNLKLLIVPPQPRSEQYDTISRNRLRLLTETHLDRNGEVRWNSSDSIVPPRAFRDAYIELPDGQHAAHGRETFELPGSTINMLIVIRNHP